MNGRNKLERIMMVKAMEYIARQVNDEEVFFYWLENGVADGDIPYGSLEVRLDDEEMLECYYEDDKDFAVLMDDFLRLMRAAQKSGGLYCGDVVSMSVGEWNEAHKK